jgi:hypothetical protein
MSPRGPAGRVRKKRCHDVSILILAGVGWCLGVNPRSEALDNGHAAVATGAWAGMTIRFRCGALRPGVLPRHRYSKQLALLGNIVSTAAIGRHPPGTGINLNRGPKILASTRPLLLR